MGMNSLRTIVVCLFLLGMPLFAQNRTTPAGTAPAFEASGGYVFMSMTSPAASRLNFNGIDGNATMQFAPRLGAQIDFTFARSGGVPGTGHSDRMFSALIGPVFYLRQHGKTDIFVHGLFGMGWIDSAVLVSPTSEFKGYETRFSYAFGGAYERTVQGPFAFRLTGDYQRTTFVNSTLSLIGQNNLRATVGVVYRFGNY